MAWQFPSASAEDAVWCPSWKDALETRMAPHSNIRAWEIPWAEEPGGPLSMGSQKSLTRLSD